MGKIDSRIGELFRIKGDLASLDARKKELEDEIIKLLDDKQLDSYEWEDNGLAGKATPVFSSTISFDVDGLEEELGQGMWRQVTHRVLDQKKREDKVSKGKIDISVVADHSTEKARRPYIKVTLAKS